VLERGDERLLDGLFGEVEIAKLADERGKRPPGLLAEDAIDDGARIRGTGIGGLGIGLRSLRGGCVWPQISSSQIGRTSIAP
jgi:hypothetical protein